MSDDEFVLEDATNRNKVPNIARTREARSTGLDTIARLQLEVDRYYKDLTKLNGLDPITAFQRLSAYSARASEIRSQLFRIESRKSQSFRTQQIDPFLEELDRQFKIHSRLQAIREMEFKMVGPL